MKQSNRFLSDMLDIELPGAESDVVWCACNPVSATAVSGAVLLDVPFQAFDRTVTKEDPDVPRVSREVRILAYGDSVVRVTMALGPDVPDDENVMLEWDPSLRPTPLSVVSTDEGWHIVDADGAIRMRVRTKEAPLRPWRDLFDAPPEMLQAAVLPDGAVEVPFMDHDGFFPDLWDSLPLAYVERNGKPHRTVFSLHAAHDEKFAGTGERFVGMNLSGKTLLLENEDALGANSRRCYKNVPFYVSSRLYGLLILTSAHVRLSMADVSTRAVQAMVESDVLDMFFISGGSLEAILRNYRRITGFPKSIPLWSLGVWMSRMTYRSAYETRQVAQNLRNGGFPCDVIHVDTGWFARDWHCDWEFSTDNFPDPEGYFHRMRERGFRVSLWQLPFICRDNKHFEALLERGRIGRRPLTEGEVDEEDEKLDGVGLTHRWMLDFSNPDTVKWYQGIIEQLIKTGASAIKADFGEEIDMKANYHGADARLLHNIYGLLYQKAVYEATERSAGEAMIWARAGWAGCQRYPVHWSGDASCTWDGLAGCIRGGLHLGLSGFAFWAHDVPGFHGEPDYMGSWPSDELYVRWTQVGVFSSHFRYHGAQPREPYEYPRVADVVRQWLKLRYALIPYLADQCDKAVRTGFPVLRSMVFHHSDDPTCWTIDDQFYCGDSLLVAPILNAEGERNVYLPKGWWTDLWTGENVKGPRWIEVKGYPLSCAPVYAVSGASIRVYPEAVSCTDEMDLERPISLAFDSRYRGLRSSVLGEIVRLPLEPMPSEARTSNWGGPPSATTLFPGGGPSMSAGEERS